ncbi:molecular chaperone protein [Babesia ovis]|uniref:Molecular chaperone protein n=1 Tax=Babesia ovis TaxID=5869 RepID=A0A9W5T8A0_BABOV|nr:molecular chaperone protein [Babesia ovis]
MKFILLSFVISPVVRYLDNPKRLWNRFRPTAGREIAMLLLLSVVFVSNLKADQNYFQHLSVTPHDSTDAIKKAFKTEAIRLHPDRNTSATSSEEYTKLTSMYKTLINDKKREVYSRYGDLLRGKMDKVVEMGPMDVLYVVLMNTAGAMIGMFITVLVHGSNVINNSAMLYEIFCFLLDVYLRFAPDATAFLCGVPILKNYTVFELIAFLRSFRVMFLYYSSILQGDSPEFPVKTGVSLLRNNAASIEILDEHISAVNAMVTSKVPLEDSDIVWRGKPGVGDDYGNCWNEAVRFSSNEADYHHESQIDRICGRREKRNLLWLRRNRGLIRHLLRKAEDAMERSHSSTLFFFLVMAVVWFIL